MRRGKPIWDSRSSYMQDIEVNAQKCFLMGWMLSNSALANRKPAVLAKAAEFYEKAANLGDMRAQFNLATMLQHGIGIDEDLGRSYQLMQGCARAGIARAKTNLGWMLEKGMVDDSDYVDDLQEKVISLYQQGAKGGHIGAYCNLGFLFYAQGHIEKALIYFRRAARGGHPGANFFLGRHHYKKINNATSLFFLQDNLDDSLEEALFYFKEGAKLEHHFCMDALVKIYEAQEKMALADSWRRRATIAVRQSKDPLWRFRQYQAGVKIGDYEFKNSWHFVAAITRDSALESGLINEQCLKEMHSSNQLEYIGDRLLNLFVAESLILNQPDMNRKILNEQYQRFTRNADGSHRHGGPMYRVAKELGLESLIIKSPTDLKYSRRRGADKKKRTIETQMANHVEMLIAAIDQDGGLEVARTFVTTYWEKLGLNKSLSSEVDFGASDDEDNDYSALLRASFLLPEGRRENQADDRLLREDKKAARSVSPLESHG